MGPRYDQIKESEFTDWMIHTFGHTYRRRTAPITPPRRFRRTSGRARQLVARNRHLLQVSRRNALGRS